MSVSELLKLCIVDYDGRLMASVDNALGADIFRVLLLVT